MSPTVRHDSPSLDLDVVRARPVPARARVYACSLAVLALVLLGVLIATGEPLPAPGWVLVLALPLAWCMNRYVFFPNEIGVTADAAVLFAAMVVFRDDAQWVGPLLLALLVGPLDARHWGARAWTRMAYNSGSTALVTAVGLEIFVPLSRALGTSWTATLAAAAITAVPYVATESVFGVTLVALLGERPSAAARHQLALNTIALPLAVTGAIAGIAALDVGWWCALLVLLVAALVPELLLVVLPRRAGRRPALLLVTAVTLLAVAIPLTGSAATLTAMAGVAVLVALESRAARRRVPPSLAAVALVPALVVPPAGQRVAAVLVVVTVSTAASWWSSAVAPSSRRVSVVWLTPLCCTAWFAATLWAEVGSAGGSAFVALVLVALTVVAACGAPPWRSRFVGRWSAAHLAHRVRTLFVVFGSVTATLGAVALLPGRAAEEVAVVGGACLQVVLGMALVTVRQWRFAPVGRIRDAALMVVTAVASTAVVASCSGWPVAVAIAASLVVTARVAWPLVRTRSSQAAPSRPGSISSR